MEHDIARNLIIMGAKNFPQNKISKRHYPLYEAKILQLPYKFVYIFVFKCICTERFSYYTRMGKIRVAVVRMEKDIQFMIITIALLTQKNVTMARCT